MASCKINDGNDAKPEAELISMYRGLLSSDEFMLYCHIERERRVIEQGMRDSKEEGREEGKIEEIKKIIYTKYGVHDLEWLNDCTETQLDRIHMFIFENISYEEFKEKIMGI